MTAATAQHPQATDVVDLMKGLYGLEVKSVDVPATDLYSIAEFDDDSGTPAGFIACDLAGGCRMGAALTQVPAGRVDEAVAEGKLPDALAENLDEIFNICVNLIAPTAGSHVTLNRVAHGGESAEFADLSAAMAPRSAVEYGFEIERYGVCKIVVAL